MIKPCPEPMKGDRCPLCGLRYVCGRWKQKAKANAAPKGST